MQIEIADIQQLNSGGFQSAARFTEIVVVASVAVHPNGGILDPHIFEEGQIVVRESWRDAMSYSNSVRNRGEFRGECEW
jgi:hypothetical protein